jgi:hypothetical protein
MKKKERKETYAILLLMVLAGTVYFFDKLIDSNPLSPEIKNKIHSIKEISYPADALSCADFTVMNSNQNYLLKY